MYTDMVFKTRYWATFIIILCNMLPPTISHFEELKLKELERLIFR